MGPRPPTTRGRRSVGGERAGYPSPPPTRLPPPRPRHRRLPQQPPQTESLPEGRRYRILVDPMENKLLQLIVEFISRWI